MEVFLLLLDEIDDALVTAWTLMPRLLGMLAALTLMGLTVLAFLTLPVLAAGSVLLLAAASLLYHVRTSPVRSAARGH